MSKRTAQFVLIGIILLHIVILATKLMTPEMQAQFGVLTALVQGWMTNDAYHRNPDGSRSGDGGGGQ